MKTKFIGDKIAEARKRLNLSQAQLSQQLFISPQAVGKWERGESMPDIITLNRLAEILDVDLNYFSDKSFFEKEIKEDSPKNLVENQAPESNKKLHWNMSNNVWADANFSGLKNISDKLSASVIKNCLFKDADLSGIELRDNLISDCDFSNANMSNCHFKSSSISKTIFKDCVLKEAYFVDSDIKSCEFTGSDFTGVKFDNSAFRNNTIESSIWKTTSFLNTRISDIVYSGTLEDCSFENCDFVKVSFQNARLINTFFNNNENLKRIKFIDCTADRITYEFLKNSKADLSGISLIEE